MESVLGRYRNLIVLVGVLFVQVLGLAVQVKRTTDSEPTRLIRIWAVGAVSPLEKALNWVQTSTGNVWHNYLYLRGVRAQNRALKEEIERIRLDEARMSQDADQAHRLQELLGFKQQFISKTLAAQVIGSSGSEQSRAVYIDKGEKSGLKPDMAVMTADGIVGKIFRVYRSTALVLLINDQSSGVGAILEKSRLQGILRGTPAGEVVLEKVMGDEKVPVGELVLTSGGDRIFPKGLVVGRVSKVSPGNGSDLFLNVRVKPAANLGKLEEVLVVTKIDERQSEHEQNGTARAADILAERLPSVPAKPAEVLPGVAATDANATAGQPPKVRAQSLGPSAETKAPASTTPGEGAKPNAMVPAAGTGSPNTKKLTPVTAEAGTPATKKPAPPPSTSAVKTPKSQAKPAAESKPSPEDTPH
jgi:rod shape-determining protein MreC